MAILVTGGAGYIGSHTVVEISGKSFQDYRQTSEILQSRHPGPRCFK